MKNLLIALALPLMIVARPAAAMPQHADVIIRHVTVIDVEAAEPIVGQAVVLKGACLLYTSRCV